jgi:hypothetical protein
MKTTVVLVAITALIVLTQAENHDLSKRLTDKEIERDVYIHLGLEGLGNSKFKEELRSIAMKVFGETIEDDTFGDNRIARAKFILKNLINNDRVFEILKEVLGKGYYYQFFKEEEWDSYRKRMIEIYERRIEKEEEYGLNQLFHMFPVIQDQPEMKEISQWEKEQVKEIK